MYSCQCQCHGQQYMASRQGMLANKIKLNLVSDFPKEIINYSFFKTYINAVQIKLSLTCSSICFTNKSRFLLSVKNSRNGSLHKSNIWVLIYCLSWKQPSLFRRISGCSLASKRQRVQNSSHKDPTQNWVVCNGCCLQNREIASQASPPYRLVKYRTWEWLSDPSNFSAVFILLQTMWNGNRFKLLFPPSKVQTRCPVFSSTNSIFFPNRTCVQSNREEQNSKINRKKKKGKKISWGKWGTCTWKHIFCQCFLARSGGIKPRTLNDLAEGPVTKWAGYWLNKIRPISKFLVHGKWCLHWSNWCIPLHGNHAPDVEN